MTGGGYTAEVRRDRAGRILLGLSLVFVPGCEAEAMVLLSFLLGTAGGALMLGRRSQQHALAEAGALRRALASGDQREIETRLRRRLEMARRGEGVGAERQWIARAQLGGLLVAEWGSTSATPVG